ncbi:MAG TPA: hypothetical protein GX747_01310 [Tenericutes bacterium]|nr:hypothetical protein [Mycoplasmatota bacterium]
MKPEEKIKIITKFLKIFFWVLFISFCALYISQATGYYEYELHKKVIFTEEQIKKFENDVKNGANIDINDYLKNQNKYYQNNTSKLGLNISNFIGKNVKNGIKKTFEALSKLIEE